MVTMEEHKKSNPFSKANLTTLNHNSFNMIEAIGLKIIAARSP
jgi:hypothetical protein